MRLTFYIIVGYVIATLMGYGYAGEPQQSQTVSQTIDSTVDTVKRYTDLEKPNNVVTVKLKNEWEDFKEYQRKGWAEGQAQNEKNLQTVKSYWNSFASAVGSLFGTSENNKEVK